MGVLFVLLLGLGAGSVVLDVARDRRSWQLVAAGLGFVGTAFATALSPWTALVGLAVAAFVGHFLYGSRPRRTPVPMPEEVIATPEPASNVKLV